MTESLDPADWGAYRRALHAAVDDAVDAMERVRDEPVWRPVPDAVKAALREPLPRTGESLDATYARYRALIEPYPTGNRHPRFFGWVHGAGTPAGVLAELLAATMNANVGGREHAAVYVERTVIAWFAEVFGFPEAAGGLVTSGTSMGNLLALVTAREHAPDGDGPLVFYATSGVHDSILKAARIAGISEGVRFVATEGVDGRMRVADLEAQIAADRGAGRRPFLIVATAGSVDAGAFDPLDAIAAVAERERLWLHVDGAFGALVAAVPRLAHLVAGIERADSIAFDAHKWLHAPYAAGVALFRDAAKQRAAFGSAPAYLARTERGTGAGAPWFADFGLELSREFRALKLWFGLRHFGLERLAAAIDRDCALAAELGARAQAAPDLELLAPVISNIVCFRSVRDGASDAASDLLNAEIAIRVQESGRAVTSTTRIRGRLALRVCIVNHRTGAGDLDVLLAAIRDAAAAIGTEFGGIGLDSAERSGLS